MKYTLIFVLLWLSSYSVAQKYSIDNLNKANGLSSNYVNDIVQDRNGFIWIATEAGLDRFDGRNFTNYNITNSNLQDATISALLYDEEENLLWIGTKANLSILDCTTSKIRNYAELDGVHLSNIVHLARSKDNKIWITNYYDGIVCYDKVKKQATHYSSKEIKGLVNDNWCSFDDGKGNVYIGHTDKGLSIINRATNNLRHYCNDPKNTKSLPGNTVFTINSDRQGNIWVGTNQGLALFNPHKNEFINFKHNPNNPFSLVGNQIYSIREMNDGSIWITADIGGISILDLYEIDHTKPELVRFRNILHDTGEFSLSSGNIRSLLQDSFGNIWIGNFSRGLDFISHIPTPFHVLAYNHTIEPKLGKGKSVWGIYADNKDQIWVGSENEVAFYKKNKLQQRYDLTPYHGKYSSPIFSIAEDGEENMFFGMMEDGLIKLDNITKQIRRIDSEFGNLDVITFFEENKEKIWIGTRNGIYIYSNGKLEKESRISNQLTAQSVYGIRRDKQGKLWVGTYGAGIFVFDIKGKLTQHLSMQQGFFSNAISHLLMDSRGGLWAASRDAGLGYIPDTKSPRIFHKYGVNEGLRSLFIRAIQEDKSGNIWFSSDNGISCWNRTSHKISNYDNYDGIPIGNFIDGSVALATDGTIYFGSLNGVCYFNPEDVIVKHPISKIQIIDCRDISTEKKRNGELLPFSEGNNIDLKYNQNSFRISFVIPDYAQSQKVEYSYMMDGLQEVWPNTLEDNQVTFRNISPGTYVFRVKARLKNQDWDEENIATLNIRVSPPLWLSVYAKVIYLLVVFLIIYLVIRSYKKRLKLKSFREIERKNILNEQNLNQERIGFYTNITHELRTPLTLILGPLEDLTKDRQLPAHYAPKINSIHASALQLLNLINQLLEFRKTETQNRKLVVAKRDISNLVTEIGLYYVELNRNPDLKFNIQVNTEQTIIYVDAEIVTIILNNLLSNAIKYTPKGEISITLSSIYENGDSFTEIKVSDTGHGIAPDALPYIFDRYFQAKSKYQISGTGIGLSIVKSLVELHEGTINVESEIEKGTIFTFRLLTENTYNLIPDDNGYSRSTLSITEEDTVSDSLMILVVEDNTQICEYISSSLSQDYLIITAENGKTGLLQAQEKVPNIIISDVLMPEMDGIEFCRLVKNDIRTCHIPVILLTAMDSIFDKEKGYESGADSYITKPFSISLLKGRIQNILDNRHRVAGQLISSDLKGSNSIKKGLPNPLDEEFLSKLKSFILENIDTPQLDVPLLANKINMSYSAFYRKTKALTGLSPNEFIRKTKIKKSTELLISGPYNISEVAYMTGFNDVPYFRRCFKEEYGMTPSDYIKKMTI